MMCENQHSYQWDHTENALAAFSYLVKKYLGGEKDRLHEIFLETPCFSTEKYDGTNLAKDAEGNLYSRRLMIDADQERFLKTSLKRVKDANVVQFRNKLIEVAGLNSNAISKCLVYGEFICNGFYDYLDRDILGDWKVFGAVLEVKVDYSGTLEKLFTAGFIASKKTENQMQIFTNEKFLEVAEYADLDVPEIKGKNESIAEIIAKNKIDMKKGILEGLILNVYEDGFGYKLVKWKGAHELQSTSEEKALEANELIQNSDVHKDLRDAFLCIHEVITDTSENKYVTDRKKTDRRGKSKATPKEKEKKQLSSTDREIIVEGTFHCQKKFDCVEEFAKIGQLDKYTANLVREVRVHLAEEKGDFDGVDDDDNILRFIRYKVKEIVTSQLTSLDK